MRQTLGHFGVMWQMHENPAGRGLRSGARKGRRGGAPRRVMHHGVTKDLSQFVVAGSAQAPEPYL